MPPSTQLQPQIDQSISKIVIYAIINPVSCPLGADAMKRDITEALGRRGLSCSFMETCKSETALPLALQALQQGAQLILTAGGDGTVMEAINAVKGTDTPIGIIPAGTGNMLAINLNIPAIVDQAVETAINGETVKLDLVSVNDGKKFFAIMGGMGYDAQIMRETPREVKSRIGKIAYLLTALRRLRGKRFHVQLVLDDGQIINARAKSLLIANMGQLVKGVDLFPNADPTDGKIDVGILKASSPLTFLHLLYDILRRKSSENPHFDLYSAQQVTATCRRSVPLELDGDYIGKTRSLTAVVVSRAVNVRVPNATI